MKKNLNLRKLLIIVPLMMAILLAIFLRNPQDVNPGGNTGSSVEASVAASIEIAAGEATSDDSPPAVLGATSDESPQGKSDAATEATTEISTEASTQATAEVTVQAASEATAQDKPDSAAESTTQSKADAATSATTQVQTASQEDTLPEDGQYNSKDDVALYIHTYGKLPGNYITKKEAQKLGWSGGSLESYAPGKSIGGDNFGNYEGLLPKKKGRKYFECDIDTKGKSKRGAKRIIFSNDGLVYYTSDHYESFELLYGDP